MTDVTLINTNEQIDENGNSDVKTIQELEVLLLNNHYKGKSFKITNEFTTSQINNNAYHKNDYVFIHVVSDDTGLSGNIIELKRDYFLIVLIGIFITLLLLVTGRFGLMTFVSFIINGSFIVGILYVYRFINSQLLP
ncbi:hypothetical protein J8385_18920, partial [Acinetobacter baumannii]|nr:hypothetical protein [Acinetobacter baumannii]